MMKICKHCGNQIGFGGRLLGLYWYHVECAEAEEVKRLFEPKPHAPRAPYAIPAPGNDGFGTAIPRQLTEADVRRIVREELARATANEQPDAGGEQR